MIFKQDPRYQEFAASSRDGKLFVKMPRSKARALAIIWEVLQPKCEPGTAHDMRVLVNLLTEEEKASEEFGLKSVFYRLSPEDCHKDIEALSRLEGEDATGLLKAFRETLERGLNNDPEVDWITRVGGPKRDPFGGLEREENPADAELSPFNFDLAEDLIV